MSLNKDVIILLILVLGLGGAYALIKSAPKPQKKAVEAYAPLVEVSALEAGSYRPSWQTGGNVNAKPSVKLMAQVTGQVTQMNAQAVPGAWLKKGAVLAQIDDSQYQLVVQQKQASVVQAQADLDVEYGQQKNAENNYKLSGLKLNKTAKSLALREPQLAAAKAKLSIAKAELAKAQLDLDRTQLRMPFDGHVMSMNLTQGSFVATGTQVFEVVDSSEFWLQVKVPQSFVSILDEDHAVTLSKPGQWGDNTRQGKIKQVLPAVDELDRQVRVLIAIDGPLHENNKLTPVRFNDYVSVTLFGRTLGNVYELPTDAINGDGQLWVVDKNDQLQLRKISVVYKGRRQIWANVDAQPGDQKLVSSLQIAAVNMPVRVLPQANRAADEASL